MRPTRDRVIVALAMRRSGHHAVMNQLCYQLGRVLHLNNCKMTENAGIVPIKGRFRLYDNQRVADTGPLLPEEYRKLVAETEFVPNLLYSLEDADIGVDYAGAVEPHRSRTTICVVRDPFNWLASSLQRATSGAVDPRTRWDSGDQARIDGRIGMWKKQVVQCLQPDSYPYGRFVDVNYNRWVLDHAYREDLSQRLGTNFSDHGLDEVLEFGPGSSFDGTQLAGRGSQMKVMERFRRFEHDALYRSLVKDQELISLSERYFDFNPW